ncbi:hypothetical protein DRJ17_02760 [Candidatus Woesearchaeota archaeon]|nr:MAG: hypothetical protein DRJ17_02760 [Candidatus Woesearchaeota archaeon]
MARKNPQDRGMGVFRDWVDHLRNASKDKIILVQYKTDKDELEQLGIKNILYLTKPEYKVIEQIASTSKECILLFNVNDKSNELCQKIRAKLEENGVKVNTRFRKLMFTTDMREIRGLIKYIRNKATWEEGKRVAIDIFPEKK